LLAGSAVHAAPHPQRCTLPYTTLFRSRQHRDAYAGGDVYLRGPVFGLTFGRFEIGKPPLNTKKMHVLCGPSQGPFHTIHARKVKFLFFVRIDVTYFVAEVIA